MLINGNSSANSLTGTGSADTINGRAGNDWLFGAGGDDTLLGGDGNDTLFGGDGTDRLDGGAGIDTALYAVNTTPLIVDLGLGRVTFFGKPWAPETLVSIENFESGSGDDTITGSSLANLLSGNSGNDSIFGAGGDDTLKGGDGNDTLFGGDGTDRLEGGAGIDTALYAVNRTPLIVDLGLGRITFFGKPWAPETLVSIESIVTGDGNDTVYGSGAANRIEVNGGANTVFAGAGNDTIVGGDGDRAITDERDVYPKDLPAENLNGGAGNDLILGMGSQAVWEYHQGGVILQSTDRLSGGSGNDTLVGGLGNTIMTGGSGADRFEFFTDVYVNAEWYYTDIPYELGGETGVITDFNRAAGDRIAIHVEPAQLYGPIGSVGASFGGLGTDGDFFELTYQHVLVNGVTDTVARMKVGEYTYENWNAETGASETVIMEADLTITLKGFGGALQSGDFVFI